DSLDRLIRISTQQAAITHVDERCLWGAAAVGVAVRELLLGNAYFVDEVLHHLRDLAPRTLTDAIYRAPREEQGELLVGVDAQGGDVVRTVEVAFWFATHGPALEEALVFLAEAGGDTEANAGLAGALIGARDGEAGIPPRWLGQLSDAPRVRELADALVAVGS
ncbi:MAG: ADP-ribosylglycohydrolase family protein, partial [Acidimicrobiales bacterium]